MKSGFDMKSIGQCGFLARTVGVVWVMAAVFACAPVEQGDAPSPSASSADTPFAVGNATLFIHDPNRGFDEAAGIAAGLRILITEIWYPVRHGAVAPSLRRAVHGDYVFGDRAVHELMMTQTTFFHLTPDTVAQGVDQAAIDAAIDELFSRPRNSYVNAPIAVQAAPFPVVVMSHGDAGSRYNMETVCEHLAANGYVVIAPEHTGNSPYSMTGRDPALAAADGSGEDSRRWAEVVDLLDERGVYGSPDNFGQSYTPLGADRSSPAALRQLDAALLQRVEDLRATLDELGRLNQAGFFAGALDLERIGLMGRSFGGATTLAALALEDRFAAGMVVAAPSSPDLRALLPAQALAPPGVESVVLSPDGSYGLGEIHKPTLLLSGAEDSLIIGMAANMAEAAGSAAPTPDNPFPVQRQAFEKADAPAIWALLDNANHATFGVSGAYWWPHLKPTRFPRHFQPAMGEGFGSDDSLTERQQPTVREPAQGFDPDTHYELVDAGLAHRIQQDKALAFFDLAIRQDPTARDRLIDDRFEAAGLQLEWRNF